MLTGTTDATDAVGRVGAVYAVEATGMAVATPPLPLLLVRTGGRGTETVGAGAAGLPLLPLLWPAILPLPVVLPETRSGIGVAACAV